ncbi:SIS domain-containing protein [Lacticaseibacillus kribbianus]|uniref:SIS domain-containing protein n=1 Tax=Lacticaseibacillus kribbianus TaxID=2926292 RepID=UPI001CD5D544|nr:SIS domain-containing protein [Lacticaseibacillus kribbianus]
MPTMLSYIHQEQVHLPEMLRSYPAHFTPLAARLPQTGHWLVLATGSSYNAALSAKYYIERQLGVHFDIREPYHFAHYDQIAPDLTAVVAVSQSGQSTSTLEALAKVKQARPNLVSLAVTSAPDKELAQAADLTLDIQIGHEQVGYVTLGFTATTLSLMLLGLRAAALCGRVSADQERAELAELAAIAGQFDTVIARTQAFFEAHRTDLTTAPQYTAIAYGPSIGTLAEMATKFTEVIRLPSEGIELEAYMHGPYLSVNAQHRLFFIATPCAPAVHAKAQALCDYERTYTDHVFTVSFRQDTPAAPSTLRLPAVEDEFKVPLIGATVFQVLAWEITTARGVNLSDQIFTDFSDKVHNKTVQQHYV